MHLLMASFRALPLDLMMPLSRRRILWGKKNSPIFVLLFLKKIFLCSFSLTFSIQTRYLSSIVSAPLHMRTPPRLRGEKCQLKFGATFASNRRGSDTRRTWTVFQEVAQVRGCSRRGGGHDRTINPIKQSLCSPLIEPLRQRL